MATKPILRRLAAGAFGAWLGTAAPEPALAEHANPPPSASTGYWTVPGFHDLPTLGPDKAKGVIFWSHGVSRTDRQYHHPVPNAIRRIAQAGWDVIKVQRNNLFEQGWSASGTKHVEDLVERVRQAKAQGYRHVIAAGQSYGGAISLEAAARTDDVFAVLAFSPGHGSDAEWQGGVHRLFENLLGRLVEAIRKQRARRVLVSIPGADRLHPHEVRGPKVRAALEALAVPFVLFDEGLPIKGHGAVSTIQFERWYADCIRDFVEPGATLEPRERGCPSPEPVPVFFYPERLALAPSPDATEARRRLLGSWYGKWDDRSAGAVGREVCLIVEEVEGQGAIVHYLLGSGPRKDASMGSERRRVPLIQGKYLSDLPDRVSIAFALDDKADRVELTVKSVNRENTYRAVLDRGCPGAPVK
jgi:dienelactone hydrolase